MKIQIKRDEVSKYTKNHLKFKKKLRKMLMQRERNQLRARRIDGILNSMGIFDPLLDWDYRPICGCEINGMSEYYYKLKHNRLFGKNGHLLYKECISSFDGADCASEGYELWLLDNLTLVFTYYCVLEDALTGASMIYRYPLGKRIPTDMGMNAVNFLEDIGYEIYKLHCADEV